MHNSSINRVLRCFHTQTPTQPTQPRTLATHLLMGLIHKCKSSQTPSHDTGPQQHTNHLNRR